METRSEKHGDYVFTVIIQCIVLLQIIFTDREYISAIYEHQNNKGCRIGNNSFGKSTISKSE
jgi:hypothetical protein